MYRLFVVLIFNLVYSLPPPSYLDVCKIPDTTHCALSSARKAISHIIEGDRKYDIPSLRKYKLPKVNIAPGDFSLTLSDIVIHGLENMDINDVSINNTWIGIDYTVPRLELIGSYQIRGKILLFQLDSDGPINITSMGTQSTYKAEIEEFDVKEKTYVKMVNPHLNFTVERIFYKLDNLFHGDPVLEKEIDTFINENWGLLLAEVKSGMSELFSTIITSVGNGFLRKIPHKELFLKSD